MSILRARNRPPVISLGLGVTYISVGLGKIVPVKQNEVYNSSAVVELETDLTKVKINNNEFEIECDILGTHEIRAVLNETISSNKVIINVV